MILEIAIGVVAGLILWQAVLFVYGFIFGFVRAFNR